MSAPYFETARTPDQTLAMTPEDGLLIPVDAAPLGDYLNRDPAHPDAIATFRIPSYLHGNPDNFGDKVSLTVQDTKKGKQLVVTEKGQRDQVNTRSFPLKTSGTWPLGWQESTNAFSYEIGILPPKEKGAQPSISLTFAEKKDTYANSGDPNYPNVILGGGTQATRTSRAAIEEAHGAQDTKVKGHEKKISRFKRALVVGTIALGYLGFSSGGIEDKVRDSSVDAGVVLETNLKPGLESPFFPKNKKAEYQATIDSVARTAHDLDEHDTAGIEARAEKFVQDNKDQFIGAEKSEEFLKRLDEAKSIDEIVTITGSFTSFYGKKTGLLKEGAGEYMDAFDPNTPIEDLRWMAKELVSTLSPVPKKLIEEGEFSSFLFGKNTGGVTFAAKYRAPSSKNFTEIEGAIALPTPTAGQRTSVRYNRIEKPDFIAQRAKFSRAIWHEIGHSWEEKKDTLGSNVNELWQRQPNTEQEGSFAFFLRGIVNRPENISIYGTPYGERYPEQFATLLDFSVEGLPHPDEVALFGSKPNMGMQAMLVDLEVNLGLPGLSDYVAAQNLTGRSWWRVGHHQFGSSWLRGA